MTFDKDKLQKKLNEVRSYYMQFAGKKRFNPFFYLNEKVEPLQLRLKKGEESEELATAIATLQCKEPLMFKGEEEVPAKFIAIPNPPTPES